MITYMENASDLGLDRFNTWTLALLTPHPHVGTWHSYSTGHTYAKIFEARHLQFIILYLRLVFSYIKGKQRSQNVWNSVGA